MIGGLVPGSRVAWMFPGQGSQSVGMAKALYDGFAEVRALFDTADDIIGYPLSELCFEGPADTLQQTNHAQPALLVTEIAHLTALQSRYGDQFPEPAYVAGHSLGEYSALVVAGALAFDDALKVVAERGRLMQQVGSSFDESTGMVAVLGMEDEALRRICEAVGVDIANFNAPGQVVISGPQEALARAEALAKEYGARRVVPLQVSAAFHSRWMRAMSSQFAESLANVKFREPRVPVIANVTARPVCDPSEIRRLLAEQTYSPVRWVESIEFIVSEGISTFIEIGPGKVLTGLVKRIAPEASAISSEDLLAP